MAGSIFHVSPYELRPITAHIPYERKILRMFQNFPTFFLHYVTYVKVGYRWTRTDKRYVTLRCSL